MKFSRKYLQIFLFEAFSSLDTDIHWCLFITTFKYSEVIMVPILLFNGTNWLILSRLNTWEWNSLAIINIYVYTHFFFLSYNQFVHFVDEFHMKTEQLNRIRDDHWRRNDTSTPTLTMVIKQHNRKTHMCMLCRMWYAMNDLCVGDQ